MAAKEELHKESYLEQFPFISRIFRGEDGSIPSMSDIYTSLLQTADIPKADRVDAICNDQLFSYNFSPNLDPMVKEQCMALLFEIGYRVHDMQEIEPHFEEIVECTRMLGLFNYEAQKNNHAYNDRYSDSIRTIVYQGIHFAWQGQE